MISAYDKIVLNKRASCKCAALKEKCRNVEFAIVLQFNYRLVIIARRGIQTRRRCNAGVNVLTITSRHTPNTTFIVFIYAVGFHTSRIFTAILRAGMHMQ